MSSNNDWMKTNYVWVNIIIFFVNFLGQYLNGERTNTNTNSIRKSVTFVQINSFILILFNPSFKVLAQDFLLKGGEVL